MRRKTSIITILAILTLSSIILTAITMRKSDCPTTPLSVSSNSDITHECPTPRPPTIIKVHPGPHISVKWDWNSLAETSECGNVLAVRLDMQIGDESPFEPVAEYLDAVRTTYTPNNLKTDTIYRFRVRRMHKNGIYSPSDVVTTTTMKLGVMTLMRNEEATIGFVVGALLRHVDKYVVVDTQSSDSSVRLLKCIFPNEIASGHLEILHYGEITQEKPISGARSMALDALRQAGCSYFLKTDSEDVWFENGGHVANEMVDILAASPDVTTCILYFRELYQYHALETEDFLRLLMRDLDGEEQQGSFYEFMIDNPPNTHRIQRMAGAVATGSWSDELNGRKPEGVYYDVDNSIGHKEIVGAHYGWARPVNRKREKMAVMTGSMENPDTLDGRVARLHLEEGVDLKVFKEHPEAVRVYAKRIYEVVVNGTCS